MIGNRPGQTPSAGRVTPSGPGELDTLSLTATGVSDVSPLAGLDTQTWSGVTWIQLDVISVEGR